MLIVPMDPEPLSWHLFFHFLSFTLGCRDIGKMEAEGGLEVIYNNEHLMF